MPKLKDMVLRVSTYGNKIYLGTLNKTYPKVLRRSKIDFTDETIRAVAQHMKNMAKEEGINAYDFEGLGRLVWEDDTNIPLV